MAEVRLHRALVRIPSGEQARGAAAPEAAAATTEQGDRTPAERALLTIGASTWPALDHVDLVVNDGETVAVLGPSGCGKTTLLRVVAGLQALDEGQVWLGGDEVTHTPPRDRGIGMVFQNYALYPHMASRGNLGFFFKVRHREQEMEERVREVAQTLGVGFADLLDRRPRQLSGGQQQRVAIGRAIVRNPSVFLFDEPLSNLDARLRQTTRVEIKRLLRRYAISALYVTHDQAEALALGDRIAVMWRGRIAQIGPARQIHNDPVSLFVATFVGLPPCNVLPGALADGVLQIGAVAVRGVPAARQHQGPVLAAIRPDALVVADDRTIAPTPRLLLRAERMERSPTERARWVRGRVANRPATARLSDAVTDADVRPGDEVAVTFDPANALLFDPDDGRRLRG